MASKISLQRAIIAQYIKELEADQKAELLLASLFPEERAFIEDPCRMKAALCSRRSGKTWTAIVYLLVHSLLNPGTKCLYLSFDRSAAKDVVWEPYFKKICMAHNIACQFHETDLIVRLDNGSSIKVTGADYNEGAKDKLLGNFYGLVVCDEGQDWNYLEGTVESVWPTLAQLKGTICLLGTPGTSKNFYHDVVMESETEDSDPALAEPRPLKQPGWSLHRWNAFINPYPKPGWWQEEVDFKKSVNPDCESLPSFQRLYYGRWVYDETNLVYRFNSERHLIPRLPDLVPNDKWTYVMGADTGYEDDSSLVVCCFNRSDPLLFFVDSWKAPKHDLTAFDAKAKEMRAKWGTTIHVIDGAAKQAVEELKNRMGFPWECTDKGGVDKFSGMGIDMMNDDFDYNRIRVISGGNGPGPLGNTLPLRTEWEELTMDAKELKLNKKRRELASCANHCADGAMYAWRKCTHFRSKAGNVKPPKTEEEIRWETKLKHWKKTARLPKW